MKEVLARVNAALTRVDRLKPTDKAARVLALGDVSLDLDRGVARLKHAEVALTPIELELLALYDDACRAAARTRNAAA